MAIACALEDLHSSNGTYVRLRGERELQSGRRAASATRSCGMRASRKAPGVTVTMTPQAQHHRPHRRRDRCRADPRAQRRTTSPSPMSILARLIFTGAVIPMPASGALLVVCDGMGRRRRRGRLAYGGRGPASGARSQRRHVRPHRPPLYRQQQASRAKRKSRSR